MNNDELLQAIQQDQQAGKGLTVQPSVPLLRPPGQPAAPVDNAALLQMIEQDKQHQMIPDTLKGEPNPEDGLGHQAGLIGSGVARGAGETIGGLADFFTMLNQLDHPGPAAEQVSKGVRQLTSEIPQVGTQPIPGDVSDKYVDAAARGAGGALALPVPSAPLRGAAIGAMAGLGGQTAVDLNPADKYDPIARIAGSLAGGGLGIGVGPQLTRQIGTKATAAQEALQGMTPEDIRLTQAMMRRMEAQGLTPTFAQAAERVNPKLAALTSVLAEIGPETAKRINLQPVQLREALLRQIDKTGGKTLPNPQIEQAGQRAAATTIEDAQAGRSNDYRAQVAQAQNRQVYPNDVAAITAQIRDEAKSLAGRQARTQLESIADRFDQQAKDFGTVGTLFAALKSERGKMRPNPTEGGLDANEATQAENILKNAYQDAARRMRVTQFLGADDQFSNTTRDVINPLTSGPVGKVAGRGFDPARPPVARLMALFQKGSDPRTTGPTDIITTGRAINKQNPAAWRNAVATFLSGKVNAAMGETPTIQQAADAVGALAGTSSQQQATRDMLRIVGEGHNLPHPEQLAQGFDVFVDSANRILRSQPKPTGQAMEDTRRAISQTPAGSALGLPYLGNMKGTLERRYFHGSIRELDALLNDPNKVQELVRLANSAKGSPAALSASRAIMASLSSSSEDNQNQE